nr:MAG TPA: Protein of unknown function (DUF3098) [Bacteriophage sp.]
MKKRTYRILIIVFFCMMMGYILVGTILNPSVYEVTRLFLSGLFLGYYTYCLYSIYEGGKE